MNCCICTSPIAGHGNNPHPLGGVGEKCCDSCNISAVIMARMCSKECKGRVDGGPSNVFVTSSVWDSQSMRGKLLFFSPTKPDFRITATVTENGAKQLAERGALVLKSAEADSTGELVSTYADTELVMKVIDGRIHIRIDAGSELAFWVETIVE